MSSDSPQKPNEKLKDLYPGLKQLEIVSHLNFEEDNEIHLLRIPRNVDPQLLRNVDLNIYEKGKIKIGDNEKYVIQPTPKTPNPTLVIADGNKVVHFTSNIIMSKYVKVKKEPKLIKTEKSIVPLPNNLKNRHPLFGSHFEEKIELSEDIEKKLDDAIANLMKQSMKSKKKKRTKVEQDDTHDNEVIFSLLNSSSSAKSRKSKKSLIEETLCNIKSELFTEYETDSGIAPSNKKKQKRMKEELNNSTSSFPSIKQEILNSPIPSEQSFLTSLTKKGKKKKLCLTNGTVDTEINEINDFSLLSSTLADEKKSSKKSKKKSKSGDEVLNGFSEEPTPKKVKKKKHAELS